MVDMVTVVLAQFLGGGSLNFFLVVAVRPSTGQTAKMHLAWANKDFICPWHLEHLSDHLLI